MIGEAIAFLLSAPSDIVYWIKWPIAYCAIRLMKRLKGRRFDLYYTVRSKDPAKLGVLIPRLEVELESPLPESRLVQRADEILFYGINSKSECLVVRIARGYDQAAESWIYLKMADGTTYQLGETHGYQLPFEENCSSFTCGGLQMHYLCPMRRWRIHFCGMLKETSKFEAKTEFVKFVFQWTASSNVHDFMSDTNSKSLARAIGKTQWDLPFIPPLDRPSEYLDFYSQSGVITGTVSTDETPYEMYLFGEKVRSRGKTSNIVGCKFDHILGNTPKNGFYFHVAKTSIPDTFDNLSCGFVVPPDITINVVEDEDIITKWIAAEKSSNEINGTFVAGKKYHVEGNIVGEPLVFKSRHGWCGILELRYIEFTVDNRKGSGVIISGEVLENCKKPPEKIQLLPPPKCVPLIVKFPDEISHFSHISGGKGSSLGKLTKMSSEVKKFIVPKGIIVTTAAYSDFLTKHILDEVKRLEGITYGRINGNVKDASERMSRIIEKTPLPDKIRRAIAENLAIMFGGKIDQYKFAVRSSATGEDTDQMSAAGQMDTFLGVQGLEEIFKAVTKCWASQFGFIAVEYKRRNGQILNSPMAVVIQEMVACDASGVLFTCDPVTNNPSYITITGNYGLGESVVSGSVDPDTIVLERDAKKEVTLKSISIGTKQQRIIMQDEGGTVTEDLPQHKQNRCCLSEDLAKELGKLSIQIEEYYKSPRDIEWGTLNNTIYILQSRPVTSGAGLTDFEMKHEFDAPLRCEREYLSKSNTGEVLPGATSPLGIDLVMKYFGYMCRKRSETTRPYDTFQIHVYFRSGMVPFCNHVFLAVADVVSVLDSGDSLLAQGMMISVFGRILNEPELFDIIKERTKPRKTSTLQLLCNLFFYGYNFEKLKKEVESYDFDMEKYKTSREMFDAVVNALCSSDEIGDKHFLASEMSSTWNMILFLTLGKAEGGFGTDVYLDFARLLSTMSNVESADVPAAMQNLAFRIAQDLGSDTFRSMTTEEAQNYLETSTSLAGYTFREFIKRHGHRCLKESDIHSVPWRADLKPLIKLLQNLSETAKDATPKVEEDFEKILSELHVPLNFKSRWILRFLLPNCRRAVRGREAHKSCLMKTFDYFRRGFERLSKLMVLEGRLPDTDLLYFLTLDEIDDLLRTRSPKFIARANYRRKLLPILEKYMFPEIMQGVPKPINESEDSAEKFEYLADLTMKGIPVSQGMAKGYARVAVSLEEASHLKHGEILITYSTDIGWSPYFPIVSGVVTEIGGLISHGAVVSREYGLPCVVGLHGATRQFQTGDYVLLDGNKGILQRLPKPEKGPEA